MTLRRIITFFIGFAILAFVINSQSQSFKTVLDTQTNADWKWAIISTFFFIIHSYVIFFAWAKTLFYYNIKIETKSVATIHYLSLISRYLPGGIWHLAGRFVSVVKKGFEPQKVLSSLYIEQLLALLSCLILILIFYWSSPSIYSGLTNYSLINMAIILAIPASIFVVFPRLLTTIPNLILSLIKKKKIQPFIGLQYHKLLLLHLISMLLFGIGYYFSTLIYIPTPDIVSLLGAVMLATFFGFIAIFVPSGLGIREGVLITYLNLQGIDGSIAISVVILPRLLILLAEILSIFTVLMIVNTGSKNAN